MTSSIPLLHEAPDASPSAPRHGDPLRCPHGMAGGDGLLPSADTQPGPPSTADADREAEAKSAPQAASADPEDRKSVV